MLLYSFLFLEFRRVQKREICLDQLRLSGLKAVANVALSSGIRERLGKHQQAEPLARGRHRRRQRVRQRGSTVESVRGRDGAESGREPQAGCGRTGSEERGG